MAVADFNCDGYDDLAVGAPGADVPGGDIEPIEDAGAVHVFYGGPLGIGNEGELTITQGDFGGGGQPEAGDRFGTTLAVGNFDGSRTNDFGKMVVLGPRGRHARRRRWRRRAAGLPR